MWKTGNDTEHWIINKKILENKHLEKDTCRVQK